MFYFQSTLMVISGHLKNTNVGPYNYVQWVNSTLSLKLNGDDIEKIGMREKKTGLCGQPECIWSYQLFFFFLFFGQAHPCGAFIQKYASIHYNIPCILFDTSLLHCSFTKHFFIWAESKSRHILIINCKTDIHVLIGNKWYPVWIW